MSLSMRRILGWLVVPSIDKTGPEMLVISLFFNGVGLRREHGER
jgi:hypothetical protein